MYDLFRKRTLDGGELVVSLNDTKPLQLVFAILSKDSETYQTVSISEEDALEVAAVLTQSL